VKKDLNKKKHQLLESKNSMFNDLLNSFDKSGFEGIELNGPRLSTQKPENFELLNLLEYENERFKKMDHFLNVKLPNKNDHGVMDEILRQQEENSKAKKNELAALVIPFNSATQSSMKKVFHNAFRIK